jgi:hypothetical protein
LRSGNPGKVVLLQKGQNPEGVVSRRGNRKLSNAFRVATKPTNQSQGFKANPGLELANAFGV